jgi:hypothetical protein
MADYTYDDTSLRLRLNIVLPILERQIKGLTKLVVLGGFPQLGMSADLLLKLRTQLSLAINRRTLIEAVLAGLDAVGAALMALTADGYPELPPIPLIPSLFNELKGDSSDIDSAIGMFSSPLTVSFDKSVTPIDVPQPVPPQ